MRLLAGLVFASALLVSSSAFSFDDPKALVDAIYQPYLSGQKHAALQPFYSDRLQQLFADHQVKVATNPNTVDVASTQEDAGSFDPFIDADNALLLDVKIGEPVVLGDQALVTVSFHNFDHPSLLSLALVKEADGWKVDDVSSMGQGENWMLSWLLIYDPWDVK